MQYCSYSFCDFFNSLPVKWNCSVAYVTEVVKSQTYQFMQFKKVELYSLVNQMGKENIHKKKYTKNYWINNNERKVEKNYNFTHQEKNAVYLT